MSKERIKELGNCKQRYEGEGREVQIRVRFGVEAFMTLRVAPGGLKFWRGWFWLVCLETRSEYIVAWLGVWNKCVDIRVIASKGEFAMPKIFA